MCFLRSCRGERRGEKAEIGVGGTGGSEGCDEDELRLVRIAGFSLLEDKGQSCFIYTRLMLNSYILFCAPNSTRTNSIIQIAQLPKFINHKPASRSRSISASISWSSTPALLLFLSLNDTERYSPSPPGAPTVTHTNLLLPPPLACPLSWAPSQNISAPGLSGEGRPPKRPCRIQLFRTSLMKLIFCKKEFASRTSRIRSSRELALVP